MSKTSYSYNPFISHSHSDDDEFAPSLQEALQNFAKPGYRKRNLENFRNESSLSALPHLWNNITLQPFNFDEGLTSPKKVDSHAAMAIQAPKGRSLLCQQSLGFSTAQGKSFNMLIIKSGRISNILLT